MITRPFFVIENLNNIRPYGSTNWAVGSQLFVRGVNLNWLIRAQSGTWSSRVSNSHRHQTWFMHVRAAIWSNIIIEVFYNKKWSCDHFGGFVWWRIYLALWKCDFYGDSLLPIVTREHLVKLVRWEQLWEWSEIAGLSLRSKKGTTPMEKSPKTASDHPQTMHKMQW